MTKCFFVLLLGILLGGATSLRAEEMEVDWEKAIYVSPDATGSEQNGSREKPFSSIQKALSRTLTGESATIALLEGTYTERVEIPAVLPPAPLLIVAAPKQKVIFEGGSKVSDWKPTDESGLYTFRADDVKVVFSSEAKWLDVWEGKSKIRYRRQMDAAGVKAYPGSVCLLDGSMVLAHTLDGKDPEAVDLWRNREGCGIDITRDRVTVQGISFRNYTGGSQARAITVRADHVTIRDCDFWNCVRAASVSGSNTLIENCRMQEVAQGLVCTGIDMTVRRCVIESASGVFAFSVLGQHQRDGIRYYHPAEGGTVEECVTRGFWAGLYIKTSPPLDAANAKPFNIRYNTFIDGIRWGGGQSLARYSFNLIGPDEEGVNISGALPELGAELKHNYFFNNRPSGENGNITGPVPFIDLEGGDLRTRDEVTLPKEHGKVAGSSITKVKWKLPVSPKIRLEIKPELLAQPLCVSSVRGAIITAKLSRPVEGILRYRQTGSESWEAKRSINSNRSQPKTQRTPAPSGISSPEEYRLSFLLVDGRLKPDTEYEFEIEFSTKGLTPFKTPRQTFKTSGGSRELQVSSNPDDSNDATFTELQDALDRALPGDTVRIAPGVFTTPAILVQGGVKNAPITITGAGMEKSILDGGKIPPVLLELRDLEHVVIRGLQFRWFGEAGIFMTNCKNIEVDQCFFQNGNEGTGAVNGFGIMLKNSPNATLSRSIFTRLEYGISALDSPGVVIRNNTAFLNLYSSVYLQRSCRDSRVTSNSFTFTGNTSLRIFEPDAEAFKSLVCDYNNYAAKLATIGEAAMRAYASAGVVPERADAEIEPASHYSIGTRGKSKRIIDAKVGDAPVTRYFRLSTWKEATGKDRHSIFADPLYTDPANGDFSLLPQSPNALPDGTVIGALHVGK